jgi:NitT/TauT family transport system ATP-binding protein
MIFQEVCKRFSKNAASLTVLDEFTLRIEPGSITALLGPSGCGKTTLLRLAGGLEKPDQGMITYAPSEAGPTSFLFQEPRLLPWHTVLTNVELVLKPLISVKSQRLERAMHFLEMVGLADFLRFKPDELSGGMRQRVAIARAFAYPGKVMLLDEPFQSLDYALRISLLNAFIVLWRDDRRTVLFVTHDVPEALLIADEVVCLSPRPAKIVEQLPINIPQVGRSLGDESLLTLQARIYRAMPSYT